MSDVDTGEYGDVMVLGGLNEASWPADPAAFFGEEFGEVLDEVGSLSPVNFVKFTRLRRF